MLHYLPHIAIALVVVGAFVAVWRREGDDPLWQRRWGELCAAERCRLVAALPPPPAPAASWPPRRKSNWRRDSPVATAADPARPA